MNKLKYELHRNGAHRRNIPFLLSFEEWSDIWQQSGHWDLRGKKKGQYCMSRIGDIGPYAVGNVFIQLSSDNMSQAQKGRAKSMETRKKSSDKLKGRVQSEESVNKRKGQTRTEETKKKMSEAKMGKKRAPHTAETKKKISDGVLARNAQNK